MKVTPQNLRFLMLGYRTIFQNAFAGATPRWNKFATEVSSEYEAETYGWMADLPSMREWIGERVVQNAKMYDYTLKNRDWELTLRLDKNEIEDNKYINKNLVVQQMGVSVAEHPDELLTELAEKGHQNLCFDGQYFFDTDHPTDPGNPASSTYSNYEASGFALTEANFLIARARGRKLKSANGKPLRINYTTIVVPVDLQGTAEQLFMTQKRADGSDNPLYKAVEVVVDDRLTDPAAWYLYDLSRPIKPYVYQNRKAPQFVSMDSITDDNVFNKKEFIYGVDSRDNMGYTLPQLAFKGRA